MRGVKDARKRFKSAMKVEGCITLSTSFVDPRKKNYQKKGDWRVTNWKRKNSKKLNMRDKSGQRKCMHMTLNFCNCSNEKCLHKKQRPRTKGFLDKKREPLWLRVFV